MVAVGFSAGPHEGLWAIFVYFFVQNIDGYLVVPYIARRTVDLAPALVLAMQLLLGAVRDSWACCSPTRSSPRSRWRWSTSAAAAAREAEGPSVAAEAESVLGLLLRLGTAPLHHRGAAANDLAHLDFEIRGRCRWAGARRRAVGAHRRGSAACEAVAAAFLHPGHRLGEAREDPAPW